MSGPNLSKDPGDGSAQPSNPFGPPAPGADSSGPPAYSAPPQGTPYDGSASQGPQYAGAPYQAQYPGGPAGAYGTPPPTNPMALGSLIASIAGWTLVPFVGWIVGVVLGHIARSQLRQSNEQGAGLALAGLITGYVGLALSALGILLLIIVVAVVGDSWTTWN